MKSRELPVAVSSDIDGKFMQFAVRQEAQCAPSKVDNKFFGASSSSFCKPYVLQKVQKTKNKISASLNGTKPHFYMNDCIMVQMWSTVQFLMVKACPMEFNRRLEQLMDTIFNYIFEVFS